MLSSASFFLLGADPLSPYNLNMYRITFLSASVDWVNTIACSTSGQWTASFSSSILSSDELNIYTFFIYGQNSYLYFAALSVSDGRVASTRYKSSISIASVDSSALNGDYLIATTESPVSLIIYGITSSVFTIKSISDSFLNSWGVEPSTGR